MNIFEYATKIETHYINIWERNPIKCYMKEGPVHQLPLNYRVLKFKPVSEKQPFIYATCGMSQPGDVEPLELHLLSPFETDENVELLGAICHYHRTGCRLNLNHTVNFGRPWFHESTCSYGLLSLPYLYGPDLEWMNIGILKTRFLWLIPITEKELKYRKEHGTEKLEEVFERKQLNYLDPYRDSII